MKKNCPNCQEEFECLLSNSCWCFELPITDYYQQITDLPPINDCFCSKCLKKEIKKENE